MQPLPPLAITTLPQPNIQTLPGFQVELLYEPDNQTEGSWVALTTGPNGVLFAADQYGSLYEITPPPIGAEGPTGVHRLDIEVQGAQGLCWAFDSLYAMVHGTGLIRLTDTDDDAHVDTKQLILPIQGGGEHGPHAIRTTPDGQDLLIICGNHTRLPQLNSSRFATPAGEDLLLPREPDPRGHAVGVMAPGGYLCRVSPDGTEVELLAAGMRNSYDFDVDANGEVFTYDSDMEWDLGLPWYRPTRILHLVSSADFGWRHGSGKWPAHHPDSLPSVVDIGPGSPTGVLFGTGAAFPTRYRSALFALDWTYGILYAIHLSPDGASYTGEVEHFLSGKPLPLTDATIGDDGAMYITTGGRRIASALYRVTYVGDESTSPPSQPQLTPKATTRQAFEAWHHGGADEAEIDRFWTSLDSPDRFTAHAARVALEHQGAPAIRSRVNTDSTSSIPLGALLALARVGDATDAPVIYEHLVGLHDLDRRQQLTRLRTLALTMIRHGPPPERTRTAIIDDLTPLARTDDPVIGAEVVRLLVALDAPNAVAVGLDYIDRHPGTPAPDWADIARRNDRYGADVFAMLDRPPPSDQLMVAHMLRTIDEGWTLPQRQAYLAFLNRAELSRGGMSYQGYIDRMRDRSLEASTEQERAALAPLLTPPPEADLALNIVPKGPGRVWTTRDATRVVERALTVKRDFDRGASLYRAGVCANCHQFDGSGGNAGPDLTSVANTYDVPDIIRAIVEPSHAVTDQYAMSEITLDDATTIVGVIVNADDERVLVATNFLNLDATTPIARSRITSIEKSDTSPMPAGLVNAFNAAEFGDLIAYLISGGDRDHPVFDD